MCYHNMYMYSSIFEGMFDDEMSYHSFFMIKIFCLIAQFLNYYIRVNCIISKSTVKLNLNV